MLRDASFYQLNDFRRYLSAENFQTILDNTNAKYNTAIWRNYAQWGVPSDSKEWIQGQKETPILVRASVLGTHSPKPQRNGEGWKFYTGSVPKIGHGFSIGEDDLFVLRDIRNRTGQQFADLMIDSVIGNVDKMLGGVHAELNYMTLQALSTGQINDISVDGISYDYKFPIDESHFGTVDTNWFTIEDGLGFNDEADPIDDLLAAQKWMTDGLMLNVDHWKVSKSLYDLFIRHPKVLKACCARANYHNIDYVKLTPTEVIAYAHEMGVWPIEVIDYKSRHEVDGVPVMDEPAFDKHNFVAASTQIVPFEMKCTNSIFKDRQDLGRVGSNHEYLFVEDRIAVLSSAEERPSFKNIVDCELYAAPVFRNIREIGFLTVYSEESEGKE